MTVVHEAPTRGQEAATFSWLGLVATPSFALMAALTSLVHHDGAGDVLCSTAHTPWAIGGMAPMYLLMSVFHAAPWLRLIDRLVRRRRSQA